MEYNQIKQENNENNSDKTTTKTTKKKCIICNKKQLIINKCKCGGLFCLKHRLPELHNCVFDFKNDDSNKLELGESCEFKKIDKI